MQSLINGQHATSISIADRGFQYGDGCFETVRLLGPKPILLDAHLRRLENSCLRLGISFQLTSVMQDIEQLLSTNVSAHGVLKITISRGAGGRGYRPDSNAASNRIIQLFDYPATATGADGRDNEQGVSAILCQYRLSNNRQLAGMKHLNRLDQVMASREIPESCEEGICMDQTGFVIEGCKSNLLMASGGKLFTPELSESGVNGIMLQHLCAKFAQSGQPVESAKIDLHGLQEADEILLCNSVFGVWPVIKLHRDDTVFFWPVGPYTQQAIEYKNEIFNAAN